MSDVKALRARVDALDLQLVSLLNQRATIVQEIGQQKRSAQAPVYAPHREQEVLTHVLAANAGPLSDRSMEGVFREIMGASFLLEQAVSVGYLGPAGSFSHVAAVAQFGSAVSFEELPDIRAVFNQVRRGHIDYGAVPIENSSIGGVVDTLDAFSQPGDLTIYAEVLVSIRHNLLSNADPSSIKRIYSRPEALAQCRGWLAEHFPHAELVNSPSSSGAVVSAKPEPDAAAISSDLAGRIYGVNLLYAGIEDEPNNVTRFLVLARHEAESTGEDKTSLMFTTRHEPGALVQVLNVFYEAGVNLTHIEKRPSRQKNWTYTFFVDCEGHRSDAVIRSAIKRASDLCQDLTILGSYPRADRVL